MTYSLTNPIRPIVTRRLASALRIWRGRRATSVAFDRLDDHLRRDIGWPTRAEQPQSRHQAAARIAMMSWR